MGKKVVGVIAFVAFVAVAGWNYQQSKQDLELLDLALENIEALANSDAVGKCNWATREVSAGWEAICIKGGPGDECTCGDVKKYY